MGVGRAAARCEILEQNGKILRRTERKAESAGMRSKDDEMLANVNSGALCHPAPTAGGDLAKISESQISCAESKESTM